MIGSRVDKVYVCLNLRNYKHNFRPYKGSLYLMSYTFLILIQIPEMIRVANAGMSHPSDDSPRGSIDFTGAILSAIPTLAKKSGMLNINVTPATNLNIHGVTHLSGKTFNNIIIMVSG